MDDNQGERVIAYIDGFNLYFGLRESKLRRYYWLNLNSLVNNLLLSNQILVNTKYFTSRISGSHPLGDRTKESPLEQKRKRQSIYLEAVDTLQNCQIFFGHYLGKTITCRKCGRCWMDHEEKMTDVNIATEMLTDVFTNRFDTALLISADSDLVPTVHAVRSFFPNKRIVIAFPPRRSSVELKRAANGFTTIGRRTLAKSQFPDKITKPDGYVLKKPHLWK